MLSGVDAFAVLGVPSLVMDWTQPHYFQRFAVVSVMTVDFRRAAHFTGLRQEFSVSDSVTYCYVCCTLLRVCFNVPKPVLSRLPITSYPIVLTVVLHFGRSILSYVLFVALLTLVHMTVRHLRMLVEVGEGLSLSTLKALLT